MFRSLVKHHVYMHLVIQQTFAECLLGWGAGRTELRGQGPSSNVRESDMRHLGRNPLGFLGHSVALGVYLSERTTAYLTQSLLRASKSLLCIRNARHLAVRELLPKQPWAEPSKALPTNDRPQVLPGRHGEMATCYFQALRLVAENRQRTPSPFQLSMRSMRSLGE